MVAKHPQMHACEVNNCVFAIASKKIVPSSRGKERNISNPANTSSVCSPQTPPVCIRIHEKEVCLPVPGV